MYFQNIYYFSSKFSWDCNQSTLICALASADKFEFVKFCSNINIQQAYKAMTSY